MSLPKWVKKSLVILLSILTLGLVSPEDFQWQDEVSANKPSKKSEESKFTNEYTITPSETIYDSFTINREKIIESLYEKAEENSYNKFGERITPYIENEFNEVILPKIEEAISTYVNSYPTTELPYLGISERPALGTSEKIFHIYNKQTGKDLIRFHVRRENPPKQGYWFNFHYHTNEDQFIAHHDLGNIFYSKNTPPQWGSPSKKIH